MQPGLGLALSRNRTRLMDGDLSYRYENGLSIFELTLPLAADQAGRLR